MSRAEHAPPLREGRWLEERLSINIYRYRQAEVLQYCRRDVDDSRLIRIDWPARHQRARGGLVVERAVVARPLFHVRIDDARGGAAERRLPRHPIAVGKTHL